MSRFKRRNKKLYYTILGFIVFSFIFMAYYGIQEFIEYQKPEEGQIHDVDAKQDNLYTDPDEEISGKQIKCIAFNCGDALCVLVDVGTTEFVYDTGYAETSKEIVKKMSPYIDGKIEYMVISHSHADHIGGAKRIVEKFGCDTCITSGEMDADSTQAQASMEAIEENCSKVIEDADMAFNLGEGAKLIIYENMDPGDSDNINNLSVIAMVKYGESQILMTADAEKEGEQHLRGKFKDVSLFIGGHHMSSTANTSALLHEWNPAYIFVSCKGKDSEYGFPHKAALERALSVTGEVYGTFKSGDLTFITDGSSEEVVCQKNPEPLTIEDCPNQTF